MSVLAEEVTDVAPARTTAAEACSLENYLVLPDHSMDERIARARRKLGSTAVLLGHHYQRDEVIRFADYTGDSKDRLGNRGQAPDLLRRPFHG